MNTRKLLLAVGVAGLFAVVAAAADWPQWRGPQRNGVSKETGLLKEWPKDGPKLLWQTKETGDGYSTPAVVGDRLYVLSNKGKEDEFVQARAVKDGSPIWSRRLGKCGPNQSLDYHGARSTPTVDGDLLYALGSDGDLVCAKIADGAEVWRKSLRSDFGGKPGQWAYSESPLIDGDAVVCTPGGKDATLVALDKKNGGVIWKSAVTGGDEAAYASIIVVEVGGVKQYVQMLSNGLVGVDAKTGKFLWRYDKLNGSIPANIPTPVAHDGYVYGATASGGGALVKLSVEKDEVKTEPIYNNKDLPNYMGGTVRVGDYLYGTNGKELVCVEFKTGKVMWHDKCVGPSSVCFADGCLYIHGDTNEMALVEATPEAYREKGRFKLPDAPEHTLKMERAWAYPIVANGRLYVRDLGMLWCFDVKAANAK